jgi:hypothetical protein
MSSCPNFLCVAHSSWVYKRQNKLPLCQSLYLGLPVGLTKHLCAGASIASGRVCKGINLEDGLLMPILSMICNVGPNTQTRKERILSTAVRPKKEKKGPLDKKFINGPPTSTVGFTKKRILFDLEFLRTVHLTSIGNLVPGN